MFINSVLKTMFLVDFQDIRQFLVVFQLPPDFVLITDYYPNYFQSFQEDSLQTHKKVNSLMSIDY
jgi:hypothetical protein